MFVDTAKVKLKAGKGGDGAVSFRHEIYIPKGGPDGGDGGKGGDIIFEADKDVNTLLSFRYQPELTAENGRPGSGQRSTGRSGQDLIVKVPIGTVVYKDISNRGGLHEGPPLADLTKDGAQAIIAHGGSGGFGNAHFKSSVRQTPRIAEVGEPGEEFEVRLELKTLADVGLVGLPNAGKSTFLSVVTNAKPEIADYPFTTITPNLGVATIDGKDLLIADIPGLIEGASEGKGLGHAFLRHIDRTAVLLHLVDVYSDDAGQAYKTVRAELAKYSDLASRPEVVALTKCEGLDADLIALQTAAILRENPSAVVLPISSRAHQNLSPLLRELVAAMPSSTTTTTPPQPEEEQSEIPVIKLSDKQLSDKWQVIRDGDTFTVTGEKIERFARRTDLANYASLNRLRDIMKKLGIVSELKKQGATDESLITIANKTFPLTEPSRIFSRE